MTLCPIALTAGCRSCALVSMCPLKTVIGNYEPDSDSDSDSGAASSGDSSESKQD